MNLAIGIPHEEQEDADQGRGGKWQLRSLKPWHIQLCSLLAQGLAQVEIASIMDCTPQYVSDLCKQPIIQEYVGSLSQVAALQLEAQFGKSVKAISDTLDKGSYKEKMAAARLQMEATKRIGARAQEPMERGDAQDRLLLLQERLLSLQERVVGKEQATIISTQDGTGEEIDEEEK